MQISTISLTLRYISTMNKGEISLQQSTAEQILKLIWVQADISASLRSKAASSIFSAP